MTRRNHIRMKGQLDGDLDQLINVDWNKYSTTTDRRCA
jgi:hypothetical protein